MCERFSEEIPNFIIGANFSCCGKKVCGMGNSHCNVPNTVFSTSEL